MPWSDTDIVFLRAAWRDGVSAREIAERLGMTRNAVVGKANRLKLGQHQNANPRRRPKVERWTRYLPTYGCQWPNNGAERKPPTAWCGAERKPGTPYCHEHAARAYQPRRPKFVVAAE